MKVAKLSESNIQGACRGWMALDGWRLIKTDLPQLRGMGVQEKGMADDLFIRYGGFLLGFVNTPASEVIWIEWKSKTGVHGEKQKEWQQAERARGALVWVAKQDFEPTIEGFQDHYRKSGLMRRLR